jgi:hypothetical protein
MALTNAPELTLEDHKKIEDLGGGDPVSAIVGREGYLTNVQVEDALLPPTGRGPREPAVFDRCYYESAGEPRVLVDVCSGGSAAEVAEQAAAAQVERKREWADANGIKYIVHVDQTLSEYS